MSKVVFDKMRISCDFLPYEVAKFEQLNSCVILLKNLPSDFKDRKALEEEARTMGQPIYCQVNKNFYSTIFLLLVFLALKVS